MKPELRLTLTFEGTGDGLERDRLSIDRFAPALIELQKAYRRIAQSIVQSATEYSDSRVGRYNSIVSHLSWEIDTVSHHSPVSVQLACPIPETPRGDSFALFTTETMDRAANELFDAIESEVQGVVRNGTVRKYLSLLPVGVAKQTYKLEKLDGAVREKEFGSVQGVSLDPDYPGFVVRTLPVVGVHFPPAQPEVRFAEADSVLAASASAEDVEFAINNRSRPLTALFVKEGRRTNAVWMSTANSFEPMSRQERLTYLGDRWRDTLRALAE